MSRDRPARRALAAAMAVVLAPLVAGAAFSSPGLVAGTVAWDPAERVWGSARACDPDLPSQLQPWCGLPTQVRPDASTVDAPSPGPAPCVPISGVNDRCPIWAAVHDRTDGHGGTGPYSGLGLDVVMAMAMSPDGRRVFVTGGSYGTSVSGLDFSTVGFDAATGAELWAATFDGALEYDQDAPFGPNAIAVSPDGARVYVTGILDLGSPGIKGEADYGTVAYDAATGAEVWSAVYDGPIEEFDIPYAVAVSPDGERVYVTGSSQQSYNVFDFGGEETRIPNADYATVAYEAATGEPVWVATYDDVVKNVDAALDVAVSPDGRRVIVTGASVCKNTKDAVTVAYDAGLADPSEGGRELWSKCYDGQQGGFYGDFTNSIAMSPDGERVYVGGITTVGATPAPDQDWRYRYLVVGYDMAEGDEVWVGQYEGAIAGFNGATALAVSPSGDRVYATGVSNGLPKWPVNYDLTGKRFPIDLDYATVAFDASTGQQDWAMRYAGAGQTRESGTAIVASADGSTVYVTGYSGLSVRELPNGAVVPVEARESSFGTIAYDAALGTQRWVALHNSSPAGVDFDNYPLLAVSPDGSRVAVAGTYVYATDQGESNFYDYGVVAYEGSPARAAPTSGPGDGCDLVRSLGATARPFAATLCPTAAGSATPGGEAARPDAGIVAAPAPPCDSVPGWSERCPAWTATYDNPDGYGGSGVGSGVGLDQVTGAAMAPSGDVVFVTGTSFGGNEKLLDAATLALDTETGERRWLARYDGPAGVDLDVPVGPSAIAVSPDGSTVYVTGYTARSLVDADFLTIAYDAATGEELWVATHTGPVEGGFDAATAVSVGPGGARVYVAGYSASLPQDQGGPDYDFSVLALDAGTGHPLWNARLGAPDGNADVPYGLGVSPDGGKVFVAGPSLRRTWDFLTAAIDSGVEDPERGGDVLWSARYDGQAFLSIGDQPFALGVAPDGSRIFVTGISRTGDWELDYATVAYDATTGARAWVTRYRGEAEAYNFATSLAVAPGGERVYVTGTSALLPYVIAGGGALVVNGPGASLGMATVAYTAETGEEAWVAREDVPGWNVTAGTSVQAMGGSVFVAGVSSNSLAVNPPVTDLVAASYSAAGERRWVARHNTSPTRSDDALFPFASVGDRGMIVAGTFHYRTDAAGNGNFYDYGILAYED